LKKKHVSFPTHSDLRLTQCKLLIRRRRQLGVQHPLVREENIDEKRTLFRTIHRNLSLGSTSRSRPEQSQDNLIRSKHDSRTGNCSKQVRRHASVQTSHPFLFRNQSETLHQTSILDSHLASLGRHGWRLRNLVLTTSCGYVMAAATPFAPAAAVNFPPNSSASSSHVRR